MKIDKAIQNLTTIETKLLEMGWAESKDSIKLGIEALKRVKESRLKVYFTTRSLLPGETKE